MFTVCYERIREYNPNLTCAQNNKRVSRKEFCKSIEEAKRVATQKMLEGYLTAIFDPSGRKVA